MSHDVNVNNPRLESVQYDLAQQIRVDFEKSFSVKGAPVSDGGREGEGRERERKREREREERRGDGMHSM